MTERHKKLCGILAIIGMVLFVLLLGWFIGRPMLRFVSEPERFRIWVDSHGIWGKVAFVGMSVFQILIALIPGEPLEIGAGYAFGALEGTILCLISVAIGGALVVTLVRRFGIKLVEVFFSTEKIRSLKFLHSTRRLNFLIFLVFLLPGTPKDLLSYFVGLTPIRLRDFLIISTVARIPSIVTSTLGGDALGMQKYILATIAFAATLVISGIGILLYRRLCEKENKAAAEEVLPEEESRDR